MLLWKFYDLGFISQKPLPIDSFYGMILFNLGKFGLLIYILLLMFMTYFAIKTQRPGLLALIVLAALFSFTSPITECYPSNVILPLFIAYELRNRQSKDSDVYSRTQRVSWR